MTPPQLDAKDLPIHPTELRQIQTLPFVSRSNAIDVIASTQTAFNYKKRPLLFHVLTFDQINFTKIGLHYIIPN